MQSGIATLNIRYKLYCVYSYTWTLYIRLSKHVIVDIHLYNQQLRHALYTVLDKFLLQKHFRKRIPLYTLRGYSFDHYKMLDSQ